MSTVECWKSLNPHVYMGTLLIDIPFRGRFASIDFNSQPQMFTTIVDNINGAQCKICESQHDLHYGYYNVYDYIPTQYNNNPTYKSRSKMLISLYCCLECRMGIMFLYMLKSNPDLFSRLVVNRGLDYEYTIRFRNDNLELRYGAYMKMIKEISKHELLQVSHFKKLAVINGMLELIYSDLRPIIYELYVRVLFYKKRSRLLG